MITSATLHLIVSEPQTLFTSGCSLPGVLPFSVCFLFFVYRICFPFFSALLFLLEADCCLSWTAAATFCEMNSLEYGWKFLITKVRLLTLNRTWKQIEDESSRWLVFTRVQFRCVKSGLHGCALAKYEHASRGSELLTEYARRHLNMPLACGRVIIYTPERGDASKQITSH